jgi:acyl phosphate:glycerol-3-phosphate acyltransferase
LVESIYFKIFYITASYLLGSVVFGYIIAKILKKEGFGKVDRPGTAGAGRQYGLKAAIPTFLFDCGKGAAIPLIGKAIGLDMQTIVIASLAVLIGHNWPLFFKFRGGGGLATAMGTGAVLLTIPFFIMLTISLSFAFIYKYTWGKKHKVNSNVVGAIIGIFLFPIIAYLFHAPLLLIILTLGIFLIIFVKGIILHMIYRKVPTAG